MKSGMREFFKNLFGIGEQNNNNLSSIEVIENSGAISVDLESAWAHIDSFGEKLLDNEPKKEKVLKKKNFVNAQGVNSKKEVARKEKTTEEHLEENDSNDLVK